MGNSTYRLELDRTKVHYSNDLALTELTNNLRSVEENVLNLVAHTITATTKDIIFKKTGFQFDNLFLILRGCSFILDSCQGRVLGFV